MSEEQSDYTVMTYPPDPYLDVYGQAACIGMMGNVPLATCDECPVMDRCHALYEDLQFGSLTRGKGSKLEAKLEGVWGGHEYTEDPKGSRLYRDGVNWPVSERPTGKEWK